MRIEVDDVTRPDVLALLEEHLRNMYELSPPDQVFAFDASKLRAPGITFWTAWENGTLYGCAALKHVKGDDRINAPWWQVLNLTNKLNVLYSQGLN